MLNSQLLTSRGGARVDVRPAHLKRCAGDDSHHVRREPMLLLGGCMDDAAHGRHVIRLEDATVRIHQQIFREVGEKQVVVPQQKLPKTHRPIDRRPIVERP